jgi:hypothetical protein
MKKNREISGGRERERAGERDRERERERVVHLLEDRSILKC